MEGTANEVKVLSKCQCQLLLDSDSEPAKLCWKQALASDGLPVEQKQAL